MGLKEMALALIPQRRRARGGAPGPDAATQEQNDPWAVVREFTPVSTGATLGGEYASSSSSGGITLDEISPSPAPSLRWSGQ